MRTAIAIVMVMASVSGAYAQSTTTGAIEGRVTDAVTKEPLAGTTVWALGSNGVLQTAMTDGDGSYKITELLPGPYVVTFFVEDLTFVHKRVDVTTNNITPVHERVVFKGTTRGDVIEIHDQAPQINPGTVEKRRKIKREDLEKLPMPGRDITTAAASSTPSARGDGVGLSIGGATGVESRYLVDGVDITGLTYGTVGTPVLSEFVEEADVIDGGFNAEWGRSTGGIVNSVIRSGSNKLRGSVFGTLSPGILALKAKATPTNASSIDVESNRSFDADFGVEISGPIIKDRLFFFLGFAPQLGRTNITRVTKRQSDCRKLLPDGTLSTCDPRLESAGGYADGTPDVDPDTNFYLTDDVDRSTHLATSETYSAVGKLSLAVTPEHQATVSLIAVPSTSKSPGIFGLPSSGGRSSGLTTDALARWTSKFGDGATELEVLAAWHRSTSHSGALDSSLDALPRQILTDGNLGAWSQLGGESQKTSLGCGDQGNDPYPYITNCPMTGSYAIGGPGAMNDDVEDRKMIRAIATQRGRFLGSHELKGGLDIEADSKQTARFYSGGALITNSIAGGVVDVMRWVELSPLNAQDPDYAQTCRTPDMNSLSMTGTRELACRYVGGRSGEPGTLVDGRTLNWAAFLRDSYRPLPNLTFNAGLRYEEQHLRYANGLIGKVDELTGEQRGTDAMTLTNNWAPRLGVIWDPTEEGASKIFGAWGRYYEAIPMDINDRSFGGEVSYTQTYSTRDTTAPCGPVDPLLGGADGTNCLSPTGSATREQINGSRGTLVAPGIKAQYMDEILAGVEYQLAPDIKVGATYQHRSLGRVIEDVSTDGAQSYIIANPGDFSREEESKLEARIAREQDDTVKTRLEDQLTLLRGIRVFDRPKRTYDAIELSIERRFTGGMMVRGAYTYSRSFGNFPGGVSYDNGQVDPNISSQYDLIELLSNRNGKLPQDRPHAVKIDGFKVFDIGKTQALTLGGRFRAVSGVPQSALGAHYLYGPDESFLIPRGAMGRSGFDHGVDVHVAYGRKLTDTVQAELFIDVFNLYNRQGTFAVDQTYAPAVRLSANGSGASENNVNPISGGSYEDLIWAKTIDANGAESAIPTARNPNFLNAASRYAPASARIGFRITF